MRRIAALSIGAVLCRPKLPILQTDTAVSIMGHHHLLLSHFVFTSCARHTSSSSSTAATPEGSYKHSTTNSTPLTPTSSPPPDCHHDSEVIQNFDVRDLDDVVRRISSDTSGRRYHVVSPFSDIYLNLAFEDYLYRNLKLSATNKNHQVLLTYVNGPAVVMGRNQNPLIECDLLRMAEEGVALARRHSGGGTVYHDEGNLNLSIITHRKFHNPADNVELLTRWLTSDEASEDLEAAFVNYNSKIEAGWLSTSTGSISKTGSSGGGSSSGVFLDEASSSEILVNRLGQLLIRDRTQYETSRRHDLFIDGKKITGSAMKLGTDIAYHHFTLLIASNRRRIGRYLTPKSQFSEVTEGTRKYVRVSNVNGFSRVDSVAVGSVPSPVATLFDFLRISDDPLEVQRSADAEKESETPSWLLKCPLARKKEDAVFLEAATECTLATATSFGDFFCRYRFPPSKKKNKTSVTSNHTDAIPVPPTPGGSTVPAPTQQGTDTDNTHHGGVRLTLSNPTVVESLAQGKLLPECTKGKDRKWLYSSPLHITTTVSMQLSCWSPFPSAEVEMDGDGGSGSSFSHRSLFRQFAFTTELRQSQVETVELTLLSPRETSDVTQTDPDAKSHHAEADPLLVVWRDILQTALVGVNPYTATESDVSSALLTVDQGCAMHNLPLEEGRRFTTEWFLLFSNITMPSVLIEVDR